VRFGLRKWLEHNPLCTEFDSTKPNKAKEKTAHANSCLSGFPLQEVDSVRVPTHKAIVIEPNT
jgi:hypothetical protein